MAIKASASVTIADVSDGLDGTGIVSAVVEYQAGSSGTTAPTGTWSTSTPSTSASSPYLWTRVTYTYTDGREPQVVYSVGSTPEGIEVGGRNLLLRSNYKTLSNISSNSKSKYGFYNASIGDHGELGSVYNLSLDTNVEYTVSFIGWLESSDTSVTYKVCADLFPDNLPETTRIFTTSPQRFVWTFKSSSSDMASCRLRFFADTQPIDVPSYITDIKLEKGNKATDWTPAPEDVDAAIDEVEQKIEFIVGSGSTASSVTLTEAAIQAITQQFTIKDYSGGTTVISGGKLVTGDLRALSATIAGWEIGDGYIRDRDSQGRYVGLGSFNKTFAFFAGGTDPIGTDAKFRVGHEGHVIATDASITGNITATTLLVKQTIYSETTTIIDTTGTINYKNILSTNADGGYNSYLGIYAESDQYTGSGVVDRAKITFALNDIRAYNGAREADINLYASGYIRISADEQVYINDCTINGALTISGGSGSFYAGNDAADWWGGKLNNLVIESWWGISFTTNCGGQAYSGTTAVGIDCRNGSIRAGGDISTAGGLDIRGGWFDLKYNGTHYGSVFVNNGTNGALSLRSSNNAPVDIMSSYGTIQCVNENWSAWAVVKAKQFSVQSSKRYKTNIVDMTEDRANLLLSMRPVSYDYAVMGCEKDQLGLIAEEVEPIDKYSIAYDEYGRPDSIDYSKFVPQLIKLCQIQQKQIDELKTKVNELKGEVTC